MAITKDTLRLVEELRRNAESLADGVTWSLTAAWLRAWDTLVWEFADALDELLALRGDRWPTRAQIGRAARTGRALDLARQALERLAARAEAEAVAAARVAAEQALAAQFGLVASQLPPGARIGFQRVTDQQVAEMVNRTAGQIHAVTLPLAAGAVDAMKRELIRGMALGLHPREVARAMLKRLEGAFNGGLARALNIARTEMLDASRNASMLSQLANSDVLQGWMWISELSTRTCASCWSQHGTVYPLDQPGPWDHQSGRCSRAPVTRSWEDLGFNIPEPASLIPDAQAAFRALPQADQLAIMGPRRLELLNRGDITWGDLSRLRQNPGWRPSFVMTPVRDLT